MNDSLYRIFAHVESEARKAISWYFEPKRWKARCSRFILQALYAPKLPSTHMVQPLEKPKARSTSLSKRTTVTQPPPLAQYRSYGRNAESPTESKIKSNGPDVRALSRLWSSPTSQRAKVQPDSRMNGLRLGQKLVGRHGASTASAGGRVVRWLSDLKVGARSVAVL